MTYSTLTSLTPREVEVARLAKAGKTNQEIAEILVISPHTVNTHMDHILEKLGIDSRREITVESFTAN